MSSISSDLIYGNAALAVMRSSLGRYEKLVMIAVLTTMEWDGATTPGVSTATVPAIAELARVCRRSAQAALGKLVAMGWLAREDHLGEAIVWTYPGPARSHVGMG